MTHRDSSAQQPAAHTRRRRPAPAASSATWPRTDSNVYDHPAPDTPASSGCDSSSSDSGSSGGSCD